MITADFCAGITGITLTLASAACMADSTPASSATQVNYQIQVIDLRPDDNITSSVQFDVDYHRSSSEVWSETISNYKIDERLDGPVLSSGVNFTHQAAYASGALESGLSSKGYSSSYGGYHGIEQLLTSFVLSPHSSLVISGHASGFANSAMSDSAHTAANIRLYGYVYGELQMHTLYRDGYSNQANANWSDNFSFTVYNPSDQETYGRFDVQALSNGYTLTPVPEPETWAMLGGGLAMLAGLQRRRKNKQA